MCTTLLLSIEYFSPGLVVGVVGSSVVVVGVVGSSVGLVGVVGSIVEALMAVKGTI